MNVLRKKKKRRMKEDTKRFRGLYVHAHVCVYIYTVNSEKERISE